MKRIAVVAIALVAFAVILAAVRPSSASGTPSGTITIAAASSLRDVMPVIGSIFEARNPGTHVRSSFAGSSQLVEQVKAGAPVDVLVTASPASMTDAIDAGAVEDPVAIAHNSMAIIVPKGNPAGVRSLRDFARSDVAVAICEPTVPCGTAATQIFARASVTVRPVTLELDVRSAVAKVAADDVDAGIVYVTDVRAADDLEAIQIPDAQNITTTYVAAGVTGSQHATTVAAFLRFLADDPQVQSAFRAAGFEQVRF